MRRKSSVVAIRSAFITFCTGMNPPQTSDTTPRPHCAWGGYFSGMRGGSCTGAPLGACPGTLRRPATPAASDASTGHPGGSGPMQHCAVSVSILGKSGLGEDGPQLFLDRCGYDSVADGTQAAVGVMVGGHLLEGENPPHGGVARLCPAGRAEGRTQHKGGQVGSGYVQALEDAAAAWGDAKVSRWRRCQSTCPSRGSG